MQHPANVPDTTPLTRNDFLRLVGTSIGVIAFTNCVSACGKESVDAKPAATVDFTINWTKSPYDNLQTKGGYVVEQGVIIAQTQAGTLVAVSANCTHAQAKLVFQGGVNRFYCPLHQSAFSTGGAVQNGPATTALTTYRVTLNPATGDIRVQG